MSDELKDTITQNAQAPQSVSIDGRSAAQHSLTEQIAADKHLLNRKASSNPAKALKFGRLIPPGSV